MKLKILKSFLFTTAVASMFVPMISCSNNIKNSITIDQTKIVANQFTGDGQYRVKLTEQPKNDLLTVKLTNDSGNLYKVILVNAKNDTQDVVVTKQQALINVKIEDYKIATTCKFKLDLTYKDKNSQDVKCEIDDCEFVAPYPIQEEENVMQVCALEDSSVRLVLNERSLPLDCWYSFDNATWMPLGTTGTIIEKGSKLYLKGNNPRGWSPSDSWNAILKFSGKVHLQGSIMSLIDSGSGTKVIPFGSSFSHLFELNDALESVSDNFLPATTLSISAYEHLFDGCTNLKNVPNLPSPCLLAECYESMFKDCKSITGTPLINFARTDYQCCCQMFYQCTSLTRTNINVLDGANIASGCFQSMFDGCTHLTETINNGIDDVSDSCYECMYRNCSCLTEACELPSVSTANNCYASMFDGCSQLTTAPSVLPARTLTRECYSQMFSKCSLLETAPEIQAIHTDINCCRMMFSQCAKLNSITVAFTNWDEENDATLGWVSDIFITHTYHPGKFYCPDDLQEKYGDNYIPTYEDQKWEVIRY